MLLCASVKQKKTPFSREVSAWRKSKGILQKEAAGIFDVTLSAYQKWETGENTPVKLAMIEVRRRMEEK